MTPSKIWSFRAFFSPKSVPIFSDDFESRKQAVFVGGSGRSGTTLFSRQMGVHPQIFTGPELNVHTYLLQHVETHRIPALFPKKSYLLYDVEFVHALCERFNLSTKQVESIRRNSSCLAEFVEKFMWLTTEAHHKKMWIEKTPANGNYLPFLFKHFPKMKFIHVLRDGRDVVCSYYARLERDVGPLKEGLHEYYVGIAKRWVREVRNAMQYAEDPRYLEVRYEDLVLHTEKTLRRVCDFLEVPFDTSILHHYKDTQQHPDPNHFASSKNATKAVTANSVRRWHKDLDDTARNLVEREQRALLQSLGYE